MLPLYFLRRLGVGFETVFFFANIALRTYRKLSRRTAAINQISCIMKIQKISTFLVLLLCGLFASAQENSVPLNSTAHGRERLFADLPDKMPLQETDLESLLELPVGAKVSATVTRNFSIVGNVVSRSNGSDAAVQSVVIKTTNRLGSTFTVTRITDKDGSVSYIGRMLNRSGSDALEIIKEGQEYTIHKKATSDLLNE